MISKKNDRMVPADRTEKIGLARRDPLNIWTDKDSLFDAFRSSFDDMLWTPTTRMTPGQFEPMRLPLLDVEDAGTEFHIALEVPGLKKENVKIEATANTLEVSAEASTEEEEKGKNYVHRERTCSRFRRSLELPEDIDTEKIEAKMEDRVLNIILPKKEPREMRKKTIEVF